MTKTNFRIVLASASPRRQQIFQDAGYTFEIANPGDVEDAVTDAESPEALAISKAIVKARVVAATLKAPFPALVIGADTIVVAGEKVIGKPVDRKDAIAILSSLSGTRHKVVTGVSLIPVFADGQDAGRAGSNGFNFSEETWISMRVISADEIADYVNSGQSDGKAGAYAIQENGDKFVEQMEGCFHNVVGFPMKRFEEELKKSMCTWGF